jgi:hypothetical protein
MSTLFTIRSRSDGKFGQGVVPPELRQHLDPLARLYLGEIPPEGLAGSTHHQWCRQSSPELRSLVDAIKSHPIWEQLSDGTGAAVCDLGEMDELYYSRAPKERGMLYGAAANYDLHVDGVFAFPGVQVYRVLIGLTDNDHVETQFPGLGVHHRLGKGEFIAFNFDRARHRVALLPDVPNDGYRILLKLHFGVSTAGGWASRYLRFVLGTYRFYETLTRRLMDAGTAPRTLPQFAVGSLAQFAIRRPRLFRLCAALPVITAALRCMGEVWFSTGLFVASAVAGGLWMGAASFLWIRYRLFRVR